MGLNSYTKQTELISTLLEIKKPKTLVTLEDTKKIFKIDDDKATILLEKLREWHILRYFNISKKATAGYVVTDYAEDQLSNRRMWIENRIKYEQTHKKSDVKV